MILVNEDLLDCFRGPGRCPWCGDYFFRLEAAHVFAKGMGGGKRLDVGINLISLCRKCHQSHHDGQRPLQCDLLALVAKREGKLQGDIEREVYRLRRAAK